MARKNSAPEKGGLIRNVAVFCGSRDGNNPLYREHARQVGELLGQNGYGFVYGGGRSGLMGAVADGAASTGTRVMSVITKAFRDAAWYSPPPSGKEIVVKTLATRKNYFRRLAQAMIVLPGGIGTFDEAWDCAADKDMKICANDGAHLHPIIAVNTLGYFDDMRAQFDRAVQSGFIHPGRERAVWFAKDPAEAVEIMNRINKEGGRRRALVPVAA